MPRPSRTIPAPLLLPVLGAIAFAPALGVAQQPRQAVVRHVDRFTTEDGLAENHVRAVVQDPAGFMWILSRGGVLQRFDGHTFVDFRLLDSAQFANRLQDVDALFLDDDGRPWAAINGLLFRIDSLHRASTRIALDHSVAAWTTDGRGTLWIIDGLSLKSVDTRSPSPIARMVARREWSAGGVVIGAGSAGTLWIASVVPGGVAVERLNVATAHSDRFAAPPMDMPVGIREDSAGRVWLSGDRGLAILEPRSARFRYFPGFQGKAATPLVPDENGGWLVATDDALARLGRDARVSEWLLSKEVFGRSALPRSIFVDREAGVWLATTTAGLVRLHTTRSAFDHYSNRSTPPLPLASNFVMALHEGRDGTLWIGTLGRGAYRVSADWQHLWRVPAPPGPRIPGSDNVWDFEEDAEGNLWIGTGTGICKLVGPVTRCHSLADEFVAIEQDGSGWFWLARYRRGLISFDPRSETFGDSSSLSIADRPITSLFVEPDSGWMWVGAGLAILRVDVNAGAITSVRRFTTPLRTDDMVYDLHRDQRGVLYAATDAGMLRFRDDSGRFELVAPALRSSTIFSIAEDSAGRLWLGSAHGLVQYEPERDYVRIYNRRDNFLSGELNRRAALVRRSGTLLFGGIEGMTEFDPDVVTGVSRNPPVVFTRWSRLTPNGKVDASLVGSSSIELQPTDRAFTIQFAALSYSPGPGRRYRYRVEGLHPEWVESTDHVATYSAPPPGRYVVQVQASAGGGGEWSSPAASLELVVIPPFWMTTWFRVALLVMAALVIWSMHRWRLRQALVAERLRLRISRDLHDEIGAGLSSIALLSDRTSAENGATSGDHQTLHRIGESARAMVANLRDIVWAIDPDADRVSDVVARMQDVASTLLRDVRITWDLPPTDASSHIDMAVRRDLLLLFKEMLHNVARHARASEVHIALHLRRDAIELTVADNGVGFSTNGSRGGTGLKSLRERADRLGGELRLDSAPGQGTRVHFTHHNT